MPLNSFTLQDLIDNFDDKEALIKKAKELGMEETTEFIPITKIVNGKTIHGVRRITKLKEK